MPLAVAAALREIELQPGDVVALNDPYAGGTHLPDVTCARAPDVGRGRGHGDTGDAGHGGTTDTETRRHGGRRGDTETGRHREPERGSSLNLPRHRVTASPRHPSPPLLYVANRAHHADIGGATPGSMGVAADIYGEGLRIPPIRLGAKWRA